MRKSILWVGIGVLLLGLFLFFMSGSTSGYGPEMKPTIPLIYGTNQAYWIGLAVLGLIILVVGLLLKKKK